MTPDEMRRAAVLLDNAAYPIDIGWLAGYSASYEATINARRDLARLLRDEADRAPDAERYRKLRAPENANVDGVHVYGQNDDCIVCGDDLDAAVDALPPPPQGREG